MTVTVGFLEDFLVKWDPEQEEYVLRCKEMENLKTIPSPKLSRALL